MKPEHEEGPATAGSVASDSDRARHARLRELFAGALKLFHRDLKPHEPWRYACRVGFG